MHLIRCEPAAAGRPGGHHRPAWSSCRRISSASFATTSAPRRTSFRRRRRGPRPTPATFVKRAMNPSDAPPGPAVANVRLLDVDGDGKLELLAAEMRYGYVMMGKPYTSNPKLDVIAQLNNPSHVSMVDFDGDGIQDFLVADLGRVPAGRPHARLGGAAARHEGRPLRTARARRLAARRRRRGRGLQRRRHARPGRRGVRLAQGRQPHGAREPHDRLHPPVVRGTPDRSQARRHPRHPGRSQQGRQDGPRRRLRPAVRAGGRLHEQRRAAGVVHAAGDLHRTASELGLLGHPGGRSRRRRRSRRAPDARRHVRRHDHQAVPRHPVAREQGLVPLRRAHAGRPAGRLPRAGRRP